MATTQCPYCDVEVSENAIEGNDGCCPECGAMISAGGGSLYQDDDYDDYDDYEDDYEDDDYDDYDDDYDDDYEDEDFDDEYEDDEDFFGDDDII